MQLSRKILTAILLTLFAGGMFLSLFFMSFGISVTVGPASEMTGCPFMLHEATVCPMSLIDHISAWKSAFLATVPVLLVILVGASAVVLTITLAPNLLRRILYFEPVLSRQIREKIYEFSIRFLQEFFSNGVLHPKLFRWLS